VEYIDVVVQHPDRTLDIVGADEGEESVGVAVHGSLLLLVGVRSAFVDLLDEIKAVGIDDVVLEHPFETGHLGPPLVRVRGPVVLPENNLGESHFVRRRGIVVVVAGDHHSATFEVRGEVIVVGCLVGSSVGIAAIFDIQKSISR